MVEEIAVGELHQRSVEERDGRDVRHAQRGRYRRLVVAARGQPAPEADQRVTLRCGVVEGEILFLGKNSQAIHGNRPHFRAPAARWARLTWPSMINREIPGSQRWSRSVNRPAVLGKIRYRPAAIPARYARATASGRIATPPPSSVAVSGGRTRCSSASIGVSVPV